MRAPISVIIPTLNAAPDLPDALACLMEGVETGLIRELVISDGGSADATILIAQDAGARVVEGPAGRGGQLRRGVGHSNGDWLLILHADTRLAAGWSDIVATHLAASPAKAGYFRLRFRATGFAPRFVAGWANMRAHLFGLPYGDQGLLVSRAVYDQCGGYPDIPLMEDVAIARSLRGRLTGLAATTSTSAVRYQTQGWLKRGGRNLWVLGRYLGGADPRTLVKSYEK